MNNSDLQARVTHLIEKGQKLCQQGCDAQAIKVATKAYQLTYQFSFKNCPAVANNLSNLAKIYYEVGNYKKAELLYQEAFRIRCQVFGEEHSDVAASLNSLGNLCASIGKYQEAELLYKKALKIQHKLLGANHSDTIITLDNLAALNESINNFSEAEKTYQKVLKIRRKIFGENHPEVAVSLNNLAKLYVSLSNYKKAEQLFQKVLKIRRKIFGENHPEVAISLHNLAEFYYEMGNYLEAKHLHQQALNIQKKILKKNHRDIATSLNGLAAAHRGIGNYSEAEDLYRKALKIRRKIFGENHPEVADSLNGLAILSATISNYSEAEDLYRKALKIRRKIFGENHPEVAITIFNLAELYDSLNDYVKAKTLYQEALKIWQKTFKEEHRYIAATLYGLAGVYRKIGNYLEAEKLHQQALKIRRKIYGEKNSSVADSLNGLATIYLSEGLYEKVEPLYQKALEIQQETLGKKHPEVATTLDNLAVLYESMGNYTRAVELYIEALKIRYDVFGENHPEFATSLNNLAKMFCVENEYKKAESLYKEALKIQCEKLGDEHSDTAATLNNLAELYREIGNYNKAISSYKKALKIWQKILGENHPDFATTLSNLAGLYREAGNYKEAESLYKKALAIRCEILGDKHPDVAASLMSLALLYASTEQRIQAIKLMKQSLLIDDIFVGKILSINSEKGRLFYLKTLQNAFYAFLSLIIQPLYSKTLLEFWWKWHLVMQKKQWMNGKTFNLWFFSLIYYLLHEKSHDPLDEMQIGFDLVLRRKSIRAEVLAIQRDSILGGRYPHLLPQLSELTALRAQIAQKVLTGPDFEDPKIYKQELAECEQKKEKIEAELARQIPEMDLNQKLQYANRIEIANNIPFGSALVEFIYFDICNFKAVLSQGEAQWKPAHYFAFVLHASSPHEVQIIDLGEAELVDQMIATFRTFITHEKETKEIEKRLGRPENYISVLPIDNGCELRAKIFDPLLPAIGNSKRLFLAPDGDLSRLPFEVLPTEDRQRLIDQYSISYLSTGRDILRFGAPSTGEPSPPVVAADPDFDLKDGASTSNPVPQVEDSIAIESSRKFTYYSQISRNLDRGIHFKRLQETRKEGERIAKLLGVKPWLGSDVRETPLKACRSPQILHIATHGFFLENQKQDPNEDKLGTTGMMGISSDISIERLSAAHIENPLLRSGLALAGANTWLKNGALPKDAEDAILTAEDVTAMDLLSTEMVVLSACETGLGEVQTGEGVFGLRRSFVLAGAKTLIMSLWKVPDKQTQELMEDFYERILAGQPRVEALRGAQLEMKKNHPEPIYWGAFICQGDPNPLKKLC